MSRPTRKKRAAQPDNTQNQLMPPPVDRHLQVIIGSPHIAGDSGKAREKYAQTIQCEQIDAMLVVDERKPKQPHIGEPIISFSEEDYDHIIYPHNEPLVVDVHIANKMVAQTMVESGASSNILFKITYENMGLHLKDLVPCTQLVYGFSCQSIAPLGQICLPLTVGQAPTTTTVMAQFLVIDVPFSL
uniref:Uncharacterized protein n=1 Tax=Cannabis sativa TaxID=3483 RepID=A0A803NPJ6_CANSA